MHFFNGKIANKNEENCYFFQSLILDFQDGKVVCMSNLKVIKQFSSPKKYIKYKLLSCAYPKSSTKRYKLDIIPFYK